MKNKLFLATLAAAVIVPAVSVTVNVDAATPSPSFKDVPKTSPYYKEITEMAGQGIIFGYTDGTFKPNDVILRRHAAALVNRAKGKALTQTTKYYKFKDVPESHPNYADIRALQQAGIFAPDSKGNFNPNKPLTREEMAKVLVIAFDLKVKADYSFPDVPAGHKSNNYVKALYSNGVTVGNNGYYKPGESLSRAHYAVFMYRAMNLDPNFVAKPIPTPTNPVKPTPTPKPDPVKPGTGNGSNTGTVADGYDKASDVPTPPGYVKGKHEEQKKKEIESISKNGQFTGAGAFTVFSPVGKMVIQVKSKAYGISEDKFISIIDQAIKTGEVYNGGNFAIYYDYWNGQVIYGEKTS